MIKLYVVFLDKRTNSPGAERAVLTINGAPDLGSEVSKKLENVVPLFLNKAEAGEYASLKGISGFSIELLPKMEEPIVKPVLMIKLPDGSWLLNSVFWT